MQPSTCNTCNTLSSAENIHQYDFIGFHFALDTGEGFFVYAIIALANISN